MSRYASSTRLTFAMVIVAATAAIGCGSQNPERTTAALDTASIHASLDSLQSAFSRTTEEELQSYVTRTALLTAPGGAAWDSLRNAVRTSSSVSPTVRIRGRETRILSPDWAYKLTTAHVSLPRPEQGDTLSADRTSLLLFHRTEDGWRIHRILNSSSPPQPIGPGPAAPDTTVDGTTTVEAQTARRPRRQ